MWTKWRLSVGVVVPPLHPAAYAGTLDQLRETLDGARLADAITLWAFCSLQSSPGARTFYDRHRA
ncbi:MAG: hypothetical protein M3493_08850, partial [Actinomycetota bacterium]|nr:hypothetical protein [Actinomycetota bacterium]